MHRFHSAEYVTKWAENVNNPVRQSVFHHVVAHLSLSPADSMHVVELACGPGMLAETILSELPKITYQCLDYSAPMLALAKKRLARFGARVTLHQMDLRENDWSSVVAWAPHAVVSMQAMHDVGDEDAHARIYGAAKELLASGGIMLNADYVRRSGQTSGPGRIEIEGHLGLLRACGYEPVKCTLDLSRYGCVVGYVP